MKITTILLAIVLSVLTASSIKNTTESQRHRGHNQNFEF